MKKIGIIGGIGPESTLDYYKDIIDAFKQDYDKNGYPELIIESLNLKAIMDLAYKNEWNIVAKIISEKCENLRNSGAVFGAIASNTPHIVFKDIQNNTKLPLLSIITATCDYIKQLNIKKVCLLGTKFTMKADFFVNELRSNNIDAIVPNDSEIELIQNKLMTEIELGIIKDETKKQFINIIDRIVKESKVEGVIMGCTELPHIVKEKDVSIQYINTTKIHIDTIIHHSKNN